MTALAKDERLLDRFMKWIDQDTPTQSLSVTEQRVPGNPVFGEENGPKGLPDGYIYSDSVGYAILIESKVQSEVSSDQLRRHLKTARRHGFDKARVWAENWPWEIRLESSEVLPLRDLQA